MTACCPDNRATCSEPRVDAGQNGPIADKPYTDTNIGYKPAGQNGQRADKPYTDTNTGSKPAVFYLGGEDGPMSFDSLPTVGQHYVSVLALLLALLWSFFMDFLFLIVYIVDLNVVVVFFQANEQTMKQDVT